MCCKAAKTACNINNAFGPGTAKECTVQWWLKKFCKENLEDECSSQPLEVDDNWEPPLKLILLDNHSRSCWRTQSRPFCGRLAFEANWKNLDKWMPHELTENLKKKSLWSVVFSYSTQQWPFLDQTVKCDEKWIFLRHLVMTSSVVEQRRRSKAKLVSENGHGHYWVICCWSGAL